MKCNAMEKDIGMANPMFRTQEGSDQNIGNAMEKDRDIQGKTKAPPQTKPYGWQTPCFHLKRAVTKT
jgi:hypothetical protein